MDKQRDFDQEEILEDIIRDGADVLSLFINENDGLEEEVGYGDRIMEVESHDHDGSRDRDDGFGDRT